MIAARYLVAMLLALSVSPALADDAAEAITVTLKDHQFAPAEIHVPAGKRVTIVLKNEDATPEEFDSSALKIEKVVAGGQQGTIHLRALPKGSYPFMGEYHEKTAKGVVIAE